MKLKSNPSWVLVIATIIFLLEMGFCVGVTYANGVLTGGAGG